MKENNIMKTQYVIKTICCLDGDRNERKVHSVFRVCEDGKHELIDSYSTFGEALSFVTLLNEKARIAAAEKAELMASVAKGSSELADFLKDHPELTQALNCAAKGYAKKKRQDEALVKRRQELRESIIELDKAINIAQKSINMLKGDILRLQKERKMAVTELQSTVRRTRTIE